jgi:hypothetical protein
VFDNCVDDFIGLYTDVELVSLLGDFCWHKVVDDIRVMPIAAIYDY